jgi:hypothetical protein
MTFLFKNREYLKFLMDREQWQNALPIALHLAPDSAADTVALAAVYGHIGDEASVDKAIQEAINTWLSDPMPAIWWSTHQLERGLVDRAQSTSAGCGKLSGFSPEREATRGTLAYRWESPHHTASVGVG